MTLPVQYRKSQVWGKKAVHAAHARNLRTAQALKRYLDLTLNGTKKNLAENGRSGRKGHPPSPYTFDKPEVESSIRQTLIAESEKAAARRTPEWVREINTKVRNHNGEAPMFTERFLPASKEEQKRPPDSRPMSGLSTKSAPIVIDGEMYYRPSKKHSFLQASHRPSSAKENRLTRATTLREKHRTQTMSAMPSNDTKLQLKRMKDVKPKPLHLNKDLLPIPCHTGETAHSFVVGARYNCTHFLDSRSFARLGLYLPRQDPLRSFLKTYRGEDAYNDAGSDSDFAGYTSVRAAGSSGKVQTASGGLAPQIHPRMQPSLPQPYVRKVVKEAWLSGNTPPQRGSAANGRKATPSNPRTQHSATTRTAKPKLQGRSPAVSPRSEKSQNVKEMTNRVNVKGQHVVASRDARTSPIRDSSPATTSKLNSFVKKQSIEAVLPTTD